MLGRNLLEWEWIDSTSLCELNPKDKSKLQGTDCVSYSYSDLTV
jgi:hypothetical protein